MDSAMSEKVILVNEQDEWVGLADKMQAHKDGLLHRAFSVFVFNSKNELLIQQRADHKYHSPGLWSNTCCSHPRKGESTFSAAHRRMKEELGFDCDIEKAFVFRYKSDVGGGLIENEYDHIYTGYSDKIPQINPEEVQDFRFIPISELLVRVEKEPETFTAWLKLALPLFISHIEEGAVTMA